MLTNASYVDHEQAGLLLPWLVNGTLSQEERNAVERHAAECAECTADIESLKSMQSAICNDALTPIVPRPDASKVLSAIDSDNSDKAWRSRGQVARYIDYAIAASVFVAITVVALVNVIPRATQPSIFETATSADDDSLTHYIIDLTFAPETTIEVRQQIFASLNSIEVTSTDDIQYSITVPLAVSSFNELQSFATAVQDLPEVESANVVALKLPVGNE